MLNINGKSAKNSTTKVTVKTQNETLHSNTLLLLASYAPVETKSKSKVYRFEFNSKALADAGVFEGNDHKKSKIYFADTDDGRVFVGFISANSLKVIPDTKGNYSVLQRSNSSIKSSRLFVNLEEKGRRDTTAAVQYYTLKPVEQLHGDVTLTMYELTLITEAELKLTSTQKQLDL
jgi:hypothetical protein